MKRIMIFLDPLKKMYNLETLNLTIDCYQDINSINYDLQFPVNHKKYLLQ